MANKSKIERYLVSLSLTYEELAEDTWVINDADAGLENVVVVLADLVVIVRVKVMTAPHQRREAFLEQLLRLNATDVIHGAYGLDGDDVLLLNTLVSETLDVEEFQATLDSFGLALAQHYPILAAYR